MFDLEKHENESEEEYLWRLGEAKDSGLLDMTWKDLSELINKEFREDDTLYRTESSYRKRYADAKKFKINVFEKLNPTSSDDISEKIRELHKAKVKLQSEKLEYNKWLREDARDEMIAEKISESISKLSQLTPPTRIKPEYNKKSWLLTISDCHYGCEFEIKDFYNNRINAYSPEIFEERMNILFNQVIDKIEQLGITELSIFELGDGIDGILRMSQLMRLRYGVIESSIRYADYIATWLNELSKYVSIKFQMVYDSNHNQLRLLDGKKNTFPDENVTKIMIALIKERLKHNENVKIFENPTGMAYSLMSTYCVVGFHGEKKDLKSNLLELSCTYGIHIDYTVSGHVHHNSMKEIGMDSAVLSVGSVIGVDPYAMTLNASSNASCSMFEFEQGKGRTAEYIFKLN